MLKEKLTSALGGIGTVLWMVISLLISVMPLVAIGGPWWLIVVLAFASFGLPLIDIPIWIWGLVCVIRENPTSTFAIIYYIVMALFFAFFIVDFVLGMKDR